MSAARLSLALAQGEVRLREAGRIAVFGPVSGMDLSALPHALVHILSRFKPDHDHFAALGYDTSTAPEGRYAAAVVVVPRAKPLAHALIAEAVAVTDGPVIVDGLKTDGVESLLRDLRKRVAVSTPLSKAHGKLFSFDAQEVFGDWAARPTRIAGGFVTMPGVFSADGIDPASTLLASHLPQNMGAQVADLGGGWGYLGAEILRRDTVEALHLVEADHVALECARQNLPDARVHLHWADVTGWHHPVLFDSVVMNPPFHTGRSANSSLGRAFVQASAKILKPAGQLWMVANRHLPYETTLSQAFSQVEEVAGDHRFKMLRAARPSRSRR